MVSSDKTNIHQPPGVSAAEAKWAAVIGDRLVPLPRRRLQARDILHQAGAKEGETLVRDFASPNDVAFEPDVEVDLASGNVFNLVAGCRLSREIPCDAAPKLAFIVDDRWEVTVEPSQTSASLRGLFGLKDDVGLIRDYESPNDKPIGDGQRIVFSEGPVFVTRKTITTIIVEGTRHEWPRPEISHAEVVTLFEPTYPQHPEITYKVTYKGGPGRKPEGILAPGATVNIKDGMCFNVSQTGQS
jgi:Multiubiquitin